MNFLEKLDFLMEKYELNKRTLSQKSDIPYTTIDAWYKKGYEGLKLTTLRKRSRHPAVQCSHKSNCHADSNSNQ